MSRPISATVNLAALRANLRLARERAPGAQVLAVVKANAYGHGLARVLPALSEADGVALIELEGAALLREQRYRRRILLLGGFYAVSELDDIVELRAGIVVHQAEQVRVLEKVKLTRPLEVFVKVNSGMNRLGFAPAETRGIVERLSKSENVAVLRLMTHFARADEPDGLAAQQRRFAEACDGLPYPRSLANSAGVFRYGDVGGDIVRPGIMLYGATPFNAESAKLLGLTAVMTLRSEIVAVQDLAPGGTVGYGNGFTAERPMRVGVVAAGYADGYPRVAPTGTPVLVGGRASRTLGRVMMDLLTVDLTGIPEVGVGSTVELWGEAIPVDEVAKRCDTVGYELLSRVTPRVAVTTVQKEHIDLEV